MQSASLLTRGLLAAPAARWAFAGTPYGATLHRTAAALAARGGGVASPPQRGALLTALTVGLSSPQAAVAVPCAGGLGGLAAAYAPVKALTIPLRCSSTRVSRSTRGTGGQRRGRPNGGTEGKPTFSNLSFDCIFQQNRP